MPIRVYPVAFDSMGVRSEATLVVVDGTRIFIDPSAALAPKRYGLPPTEYEIRALELAMNLIVELAGKSDIIIVTHYHYDHHPDPRGYGELYARIFGGKTVYVKEFEEEVTASARTRGKRFYELAKEYAREIVFADGREFKIGGGARLIFSPAVWHGPVGSKVGRVIMVNIRKGRSSFIHGSDAQNLADPAALEWVLERKPSFIIIDGYPTILMGWRVSKKSFEESMEGLFRVITETPAKTIIIDHHIVRDKNFKDKMKPLYDLAAEKGKRILTAAEYLGLENFLLEAWRKELSSGEMKVDVDEYYQRLRSKIKV